jgi:hypothetical protein
MKRLEIISYIVTMLGLGVMSYFTVRMALL